MVLFILLGFLFSVLARWPWGRKLLLDNPRLFSNGMFSHQGPSSKQIKETSFSMKFLAWGAAAPAEIPPPPPPSSSAPGAGGAGRASAGAKEAPLQLIVAGPEPGYVACSHLIVQTALCILQEGDKLPFKGGCYTPGSALRGTTIIPRLQSAGIQFKVL